MTDFLNQTIDIASVTRELLNPRDKPVETADNANLSRLIDLLNVFGGEVSSLVQASSEIYNLELKDISTADLPKYAAIYGNLIDFSQEKSGIIADINKLDAIKKNGSNFEALKAIIFRVSSKSESEYKIHLLNRFLIHVVFDVDVANASQIVIESKNAMRPDLKIKVAKKHRWKFKNDGIIFNLSESL